MHKRVCFTRRGRPSRIGWSLLLLLALAVSLPLHSQAANGQISRSGDTIAISNGAATGTLRVVLDEGSQLERQERWGEALSHYEKALREHPGNGDLRQRQDTAKLHYSLDRRYDDRSFLESIRALSSQQALGMYGELLRKIDHDFVETPPWQRLASRGIQSVHLALESDEFQAANSLQGAALGRVAAVQQSLQQIAGRRHIAGPRELTALAADAARLAEMQLSVRQSAVVLEFITSAAGGLDEYSAYLSAGQYQDVTSQIEGNFVGLGVELKADAGALLIVHVIPGSPAEKAGIQDGDRIVAVDGRSTAELSTDGAADMLTGEVGSQVQVTLQSPAQPQRSFVAYRSEQPEAQQSGATRTVTVRRDHVEVPSLEDAQIIDADGGIAYLRITAFQKTTARDLEAALWKLHAQGMRSLVLDLRGNPGGLLPAAFEVADKFLMQGKVFSTRGRNQQENFTFRANYGGTWRVPLVVLIDRESASASEIFAGAIKDNARGEIVGETSYGKGTVQGIFPLGYAGAGVRLTTAYFYSPNDHRINHRGVEPTQKVFVAARPVSTSASTLRVVDDEDIVLQAGVAAAKRRAAAPLTQ